jgi:enoyl-CoA hydratase/carnithine racemase
MTIPTTTQIRYEVKDRVAWITMNRPEAMNALGPELSQGIADAVEHAGNDDNVLCIVLIGEGGRAFSAGMDLKAMSAADSGGPALTAGPGDVFNALSACPKVVIAAIDGYCLAGGMQTANRCDMRIATRKSRFGMPEARRALAAVGTEDTPELFVPAGEAAWILLTGGHMTAERAYDIGLIQQLVEDRDELIQAAEALANEVKQCAPLALRLIKQVIRAQYNMPTPPQGVKRLDYVAELTAEARKRNSESEDRLEGPKAFAEKRAPVWKNR